MMLNWLPILAIERQLKLEPKLMNCRTDIELPHFNSPKTLRAEVIRLKARIERALPTWP
jgi:hypothetical protein